MEVKLLSYNANIVDVLYTACRTCYSKLSPIEIYNKSTEIDYDKKINLITKVMDSGHNSTTEHDIFTFAVEGVSRSLLAQITRHRLASFSVQSLRYVEIKENLDDLIVLNACGTMFDKRALLNKYFVFNDIQDEERYIDSYLRDLIDYLQLTKDGHKAEDARDVLPLAIKTNFVISCNLRELIHVCNLRLCLHAQNEIRAMVKKMVKEVTSKDECKWLAKYLVPNCKNCADFRGCPRNKKYELSTNEVK